MKKIAFFVEGQTEMLFLEALLRHVAARRQLCIDKFRAQGGGRHGKPRMMRAWARASETEEGQCDFYAQIIDCGGDSKVVSDVRENHQALVAAGFDPIIGLRDVYPDARIEEFPRLRRTLTALLPRHPLPARVIFAVMETEAWFLEEHSHYNRLDWRLSLDFIRHRLALDLRQFHGSEFPHPARDLADIYQLVDISYNKTANCVRRTLAAIDFNFLTEAMTENDPELRVLVRLVEEFFSR